MGKHQTFRANVGVIVANSRGEVLALQRAGHSGAWQMPQGGLDKGEEPLAAARRELAEETGLTAAEVKLVGEHPAWLAYELPAEARTNKTGRGQVQKWFLFRLLDDDATIDLSRASAGEFDAHVWMSLEALAKRTWVVRRPLYEQLAAHFGALL